ncbi:MAG: thioredoxin [Chloroflexi bacterium]|nr:thioredoxin [Chloroflexota bacterium]
MAKPIVVTDENFRERVLQSPKPILVDFWAEWCRPCRMLAPVIDSLAADYDGQVGFAKVNVDENQELAMRYRVQGIPTLVLLFGGKEIGRFVGYMSREQLARKLEAALPVVA